ncbi:MAG: hypothetical protein V3U30_03740 [Thermoplasmata archaeon]
MIMKRHPVRELLLAAKRRLGLDHVQVSEDAVFRLAQVLEAQGLALAESAFAAFRENNVERRRLRLADLKRLTDAHVEEASNGES